MNLSTCWLVINYQCNNRCIYCYAENTGFPASENMDLDYAKEILCSIAAAKVKNCLLIGGEPTLYPNLFELVQYGAGLGLSVRIITNGRRFSDEGFLNSLIHSGVRSCSISIPASNPEDGLYLSQVKQAWDQTVAGLRNVVRSGLSFNSLTTVNSFNKDKLFEIALFLSDLGVKRIVYNFATPNCSKDSVNLHSVLDPKIAAEAIEKAYWLAKSRGIKISFLPTLPLCLFSEQLRAEVFPIDKIGCGCHIFSGGGAVFDPRGNLLPCTHLTEFRIAKVSDDGGGFAHQHDLLGFLTNPEAAPAKLRKQIWQYPVAKCKTCEYWGACIGGCPIFRAAFQPADYIGAR